MASTKVDTRLVCYHCGEDCESDKIQSEGKVFCCSGCKMVFELLNKNNLCIYYDLNKSPGLNQKIRIRKDKFAFLDDKRIQQELISFSNPNQTHVLFNLPQIHCSSCLYLLENLYKLHSGVISARVNFMRKEVEIVFKPGLVSLRELAELLTGIGYEPYISLHDLNNKKPRFSKSLIYQLGVAGFCFANIMLLSFPEYLGLQEAEKDLQLAFRYLNFILAVPVFFFSASPFFISGWKGIKNKFLNIDAPIAFAILITFGRSVYEVLSGVGSGYFDSMSGIVFFMLVGRVLQDKTYQQLSFERDFTSYFPIAATVLKNDREIPIALPDLKPGDTLVVHNEELIPADGILTNRRALIDYSFVTGESKPIAKEVGEIVYAGGKQLGNSIEILMIKEVAQGYLASLWLRSELKEPREKKTKSFVHLLSRWFTYVVLGIALFAALYWFMHDSHRIWNAVTAVLIIACPCALLLSNTFTNGNVLRILGRNHFYLRSAQVIEDLAICNRMVFDKTGTLTNPRHQDVVYVGSPLSPGQKLGVATLVSQSNHPMSKAILAHYGARANVPVEEYKEVRGEGIEGWLINSKFALGSRKFVGKASSPFANTTEVWLSIDGKIAGHYRIQNHFRENIGPMAMELRKSHSLSLLSGDNESERPRLEKFLGREVHMLFHQSPEDKLNYIRSLQSLGEKVTMVGDGLNDAGALRQSTVGIAVAEDSNNFTPASDAILEAKQLPNLPRFIKLCRANRRIVLSSFVFSILYNIIGISFAVQGMLSPIVAAILMPASSISILLITYGSTSLAARWWKL